MICRAITAQRRPIKVGDGGVKGVRTDFCAAPSGPFREISSDPFSDPTPKGQKTRRPIARSKAGATVMQAARATTKDMAIVGPPERYLPKSAQIIAPSPRIVVIALAVKAWPV